MPEAKSTVSLRISAWAAPRPAPMYARRACGPRSIPSAVASFSALCTRRRSYPQQGGVGGERSTQPCLYRLRTADSEVRCIAVFAAPLEIGRLLADLTSA
jgi:hypothetical protein